MSRKLKEPPKTPEIERCGAGQQEEMAVLDSPKETNTACFNDESPRFLTPYETVGYLRKRNKELGLFLREEDDARPIRALGEEWITARLSPVLRMSIALRMALEKDPMTDPGVHHSERLKRVNPVRVKKPPGTLLQLALPPLLESRVGGGYDLYWYAKDAIMEFEKETRIFCPQVGPTLIIYKRYLLQGRKTAAMDNDNFEAKRITNAICEGIGKDDNSLSMSFFYTAVESAYEGLEATAIEAKDLIRFIPYITNPEPEDPGFLTYH